MEANTYRFSYDRNAQKWQVPTPRRYRPLGISKSGRFETYQIRNCPDWLTWADLARQMPKPPKGRQYLDFAIRHHWQHLGEGV
ncbi:MAG: hypothetical protein HC833_10780 [Leptolyngbyaceae cyanobacterium RM1_406_9]|nr:hypothetical protein [Leptolyngbyaceae cyanobacterium RM1_406_9]